MITFDDGVMKFYKLKNTAPDGAMPNEELEFLCEEKYAISALGVTRYYAAQQAGVQIQNVIDIYLNPNIKVNDIAVDEFENQTRISMIQLVEDDGLRIMRLTLERIDHCYEFSSSC